MKMATAIVLALTLGVTACNQAGDAAKVDVAAEEAAIRAKEASWNDAYNKRDGSALAAQYADDGALANPGTQLATTPEARSALLNSVAADPALKVEFASDRVIVAKSGELASSRGHYTMTYSDPATKQPKTETGNYLTVYRKQPDGSWAAVEDFITPGAPAAAAAQ